MSLVIAILKLEEGRRIFVKRFKASMVRYGHGMVYAESKMEAESKAKYLQADEIEWVESNGSKNLLVSIEEIPAAEEKFQ